MEETWKDIEGYEGLYQISNLGRVKSLGGQKWKKEQLIKQRTTPNCSYFIVRLTKNRIERVNLVHRLVAQAFIPNPDNLREVNHKDENKLNNNVDNLEWCTREYNLNYGKCQERHSKNMRNKKSLSKPVIQYTLDGQFVAEYPSIKEAQRITGIFDTNIVRVCKGKLRKTGGFIWKYKDSN